MKSDELRVFISTKDSVCDECKQELGRKAWITLVEKKGALCLSCAELDHLVFLPSGEPREDAPVPPGRGSTGTLGGFGERETSNLFG